MKKKILLKVISTFFSLCCYRYSCGVDSAIILCLEQFLELI